MKRIGAGLLWGLIGGVMIARHVAQTERAAMEERLLRARTRLRTVTGIARRLRGERDEARRAYVEAADYVRNIDQHGLRILREEDVAYLRSESDRAEHADAERRRLRGVVQVIASGGRVTPEAAAEALGCSEDGPRSEVEPC